MKLEIEITENVATKIHEPDAPDVPAGLGAGSRLWESVDVLSEDKERRVAEMTDWQWGFTWCIIIEVIAWNVFKILYGGT